MPISKTRLPGTTAAIKALVRGCGDSGSVPSPSITFLLRAELLERMLEAGKKLPSFKLADDTGKTRSTKDFLGKSLVLYFYPKDDTPGCTNEATQFRDLYDDFVAKGAEIVGVSRDSVASHQKFKAKYDLQFALLSDSESELCNALGVIVEKNMYGKKSMGIQRSTFLIDPKGKIVHVWPKVSVNGHAEDVLEALT
jgi:peroxiredoxin Q/BCP